ncbi:trans-aconitate methyltransferase [Sphaerisporangium rubeum]|uniref:SAM-dependent methyltransferase n=1 Tax=Sphaerisporangium rubeum TaxID=321317 RepID=A0A7X0MA57_9ACTN|nr:class I SAM-dependent methyltransferase [Sphaerisporangium rubeum]MBB6475641.1 SAM-dependent methyltransferase [Sphaerisporangium rubeum]
MTAAAAETRYPPEWLALREPADAAARATDLLPPLLAALPAGPLVVRDLGCGTGAMGRWLSPRLPAPQHWVLHDRDPHLLGLAAASLRGSGVAVTPEQGDVTALRADDLAGTSLVTASALLDLLTAAEMDALAAACAGAGCAALLTLSVAGRVELDPYDPLDDDVMAAFNEHQRRTVDGRRLLGPDAVAAAIRAFTVRGANVRTQPSPWRLGPEQRGLTAEWLRGWVAAAVEQDRDLAPHTEDYLRRRLGTATRVVVHHDDLLALPEVRA